MAKSWFPKSLRKFLRREKAVLRRENLLAEEIEKKITELVEKTAAAYHKRKGRK